MSHVSNGLPLVAPTKSEAYACPPCLPRLGPVAKADAAGTAWAAIPRRPGSVVVA
jgi:hypothetical protein